MYYTNKQDIIDAYEQIEMDIMNLTSRQVSNRRGVIDMTPINKSIGIFNWICPVKSGATTVLAADAGSGKTFIINGLLRSVNVPNKVRFRVGECSRDEDKITIDGVVDFTIKDPRIKLKSVVNEINALIAYIENLILRGEDVFLTIDSLTRIITAIGKNIPSSIPGMGAASSGGLTTDSFNLAQDLLSLAGTYDTGSQVTVVATCLGGEDAAGKIVIEWADSVASAIVPLMKVEDRNQLNDSPSFNFKSKFFSYREIGGNTIAQRWGTLKTEYKSRPSEYICSKIAERM